jgi:hypothetical protein
MVCAGILLVNGGIEGVLVWALRKAYYQHGLEWPMTLTGAVAFVLLAAGYVPIPFELIKRRGRVVGIDFWFLTIEWFGSFFSLVSLSKCIPLHLEEVNDTNDEKLPKPPLIRFLVRSMPSVRQ